MSENSSSPSKNSVMVRPGGPLIARGDVEIRDKDGNLLVSGNDIALCRCGASNNKPFCDGAHQRIGFDHDGQFTDEKAEALEGNGPLVIQCRENAMLLAKGPMQVISRDGKSTTTRNKAAFCRCGHSTNKPFCDAKHKQFEFKSV